MNDKGEVVGKIQEEDEGAAHSHILQGKKTLRVPMGQEGKRRFTPKGKAVGRLIILFNIVKLFI